MEKQHTKHVTYKIAYHFVWCPKYRKHVLVWEVAQFIEAEIRRLCEENHWKIGALSVLEDHIHSFIGAQLRTTPLLIANTLKGITARQVFKYFPALSSSKYGAALSGLVRIMWAQGAI